MKYGLCTKCVKYGMHKVKSSRTGYTKLKCRYCGKTDVYSS